MTLQDKQMGIALATFGWATACVLMSAWSSHCSGGQTWESNTKSVSADTFTSFVIDRRRGRLFHVGVNAGWGVVIRSYSAGRNASTQYMLSKAGLYSVSLAKNGTLALGGWEYSSDRQLDRGTITVCNATTGKTIWRHDDAHRSATSATRFSSDATLLATAGWDAVIKVWDAKNGDLRATLRGHSHSIWALRFSHDGRLLVSCSSDGTVRLWDIKRKAVVRVLRGYDKPVYSVAMTRDGTMIAAGGGNQSIRVWDARTGKMVRELPGNKSGITYVAFGGGREALFAADREGAIICWDFKKGIRRWTQKCAAEVHTLAVYDDGESLIASTKSGEVTRFTIRTGRVLRRWQVVRAPSATARN